MGRAMSIFMLGGELSRVMGPLLITGAIALFTLEGSFVVMYLRHRGLDHPAFQPRHVRVRRQTARRAAVSLKPLLRARRKPITGLLAFGILLTGIGTTPFSFFLVDLMVEKGHGHWYGAIALSTLYASGIVGGLAGGILSDRLGRRAC